MMKTFMQPDPRDYEIRIWYSAEKGDECFIAQLVEWPGIMAHGDTREEAAREIQVALEGALQVAAEQGIKPAAPAAICSGHFTCRARLLANAFGVAQQRRMTTETLAKMDVTEDLI